MDYFEDAAKSKSHQGPLGIYIKAGKLCIGVKREKFNI